MSAKILKGKVVSDKMQKTIVVKVEIVKMHPRYKKRYRVHRTFKAHSEVKGIKIGDVVSIKESKPFSKTKNWVVVPDHAKPAQKSQ